MQDDSDFDFDCVHQQAGADQSAMESEDQEDLPLKRAEIRSKYSKTDLQQAIDAVNDGTSYAKAAQRFGISRQTLHNRVKGKHSQPVGRPPVLNKGLEVELSQWAKDCDSLEDPKTPRQLLKAAKHLSTLSRKTFKNTVPSRAFLQSFMKRNGGLSFRKPQPLSRAAANVTPSNVQQSIINIRNFLIEKGFGHILDDPRAFANGDETGYALNPTPKKVTARTGSKAYRVETANLKENVTVFNCILASGESMNPQVILKESVGTVVEVARACDEVGAKFCLQQTEKGWQTKKSFYDYITTKFVEELDSMGIVRRSDYPFVLFLDNHVSHTSFEFFKWCKENFIIIVTFYPNSTFISQPLDYGVFGAANDENQNQELKLVDFVKVLHEVQKQVFTEEINKNAFRGTGVYPLNEQNIHIERCIGQDRPVTQAAPPAVSEPVEVEFFDENAQCSFLFAENHSSSSSSNSNSNAFSEDNSLNATAGTDEKLLQIKMLVESIEKDFHADPEKLFMCGIMKQQLKLLQCPSSPTSPAEILVRPTPFSRSTPGNGCRQKKS